VDSATARVWSGRAHSHWPGRQYFLLATNIQKATHAPPAGEPLMGGLGPAHFGTVCSASGPCRGVRAASTGMALSGRTARNPPWRIPGPGTQDSEQFKATGITHWCIRVTLRSMQGSILALAVSCGSQHLAQALCVACFSTDRWLHPCSNVGPVLLLATVVIRFTYRERSHNYQPRISGCP
jgi:hypothetical protein